MTKTTSDAPAVDAPRSLDTLPSVAVIPGLLRKSPFTFLSEAARQHGELVRLKIGPKSVYLVSSPSLFQHILRDNVKNYRKSAFLYNAAKPMVGEGLLTSDGDFWLRQRRMMQPHFHRQRIAHFATMMTDVIADIVGQWDRSGVGEVEVGERMAQLTVEIISRTLFGTSTLTPEEIAKLGHDMMSAANYVALRGYMPFIPQSIPMPGHTRFYRAISHLSQAVNTIIEAGRQKEGHDDSLITMLLEAVDEETGGRMTNAQLFDEVMTVFSAGFETTATALTWLMWVLGQHPEIEAKMRAEIDGALQGRPPKVEDLSKLGYCRQVLQETMRFYPPAPMVPRTTLEDDVVDGYFIPKGTIVLMFFYGLHHNPAYWPDSETFDPDRFTPQQIEARHRFAYLPFSTGPRQCIGNDFAMMEATLVTVMLLQRYQIAVTPGQNFLPNLSATLKPSKGIQATMHKREAAV